MAWPPVTMATQHPDNASVPWWRSDPFIPTQDEIDELLLLFRELPIDEYMWDWEGKYVDEAVGEKLYAKASDYFAKRPLGEDIHLTYRIPAFDGGKMHRMARAFMNVLSLSDLSRDLGLPRPPVTEMFLPLTTSADQVTAVRKAFREIAGYHRAVFHQTPQEEHRILSLCTVTPLVEDCDSLFAIRSIVEPYWKELLKEGGVGERGVRIFLARSDPAMNAGLVPAVLAVKAALSETAEIGAELGIPVHPVLGTGSLPFRGSVRPGNEESFLRQYSGVRTYSIQSAFRYDFPKADVQASLETLQREVPGRSIEMLSTEDRAALQSLSAAFTALWQPAIEQLADLINQVSHAVPSRRERLQHIGLFGYSRGVGAVKLPRAIKFTGALYSIGVPPELIATGRGLRIARERGLLPLLERVYPALRDDLTFAGRSLNRENLELLRRRHEVFAGIAADVEAIEEVLGLTLGPAEAPDMIHRNLTSTILHRLWAPQTDPHALEKDIVEAGILRRSLG